MNSSIMANEDEVRGEFQSLGVVVRNPDIIDKLLEICIVYKVAASDLAEHWFAFCTSHNLDSQPTVESLVKLENEEFNCKRHNRSFSKSAKIKKCVGSPRVNDLNKSLCRAPEINSNADDSLLLEAYGTPDICAAKKRERTPDSLPCKRLTGSQVFERSLDEPLHCTVAEPGSLLSVTRPSPSSTYARRSVSGDAFIVFNKSGGKRSDFGSSRLANEPDSSAVWIEPYLEDETLLKKRYNYMFLKLASISAILDYRIDEIGAILQEVNGDNSQVSSVSEQTADEVTVIGMITCDGNGRLGSNSVMLTGSAETSNGRQVYLDISKLPSYSLFPGQIVVISGTNSTGHRFFCDKLHPNTIGPEFPQAPPPFPEDFLSFNVSCGPYMASDSLSYDPLNDILKVVADQKPHVCILIGPFVDARQKLIEEGGFEETYDDIFACCMELILSFSRGSSTKFVIVPSIRDIHHDFVYPTPPFSCSKIYSNEKNIHFVSDPSVLNICGVIVGITSTDVLMHLGREEISLPAAKGRVGRLASHLLLQRSFYPIYPPSEEINIDYEKLETFGRLPVTPHILILPSDLVAFVKDVQGCCCINPQRLTRGSGGGTYARISVNLANADVGNSESSTSPKGSIISRTTCEIVRI